MNSASCFLFFVLNLMMSSSSFSKQDEQCFSEQDEQCLLLFVLNLFFVFFCLVSVCLNVFVLNRFLDFLAASCVRICSSSGRRWMILGSLLKWSPVGSRISVSVRLHNGFLRSIRLRQDCVRVLKVTVEEENGSNVSITVRLYGPNTDYVINRDQELQAIKYLSAAGFGAKLLGVFKNGMVQSFIHARTLEPSDIRKPELAAEIAKQLNKFHKVYIPGSTEPQLWNEILKCYGKASALQFDDTEKQCIFDSISFTEIHNEILEIKEVTSLLDAPVVFSHNDLLSGNLMLNEEEERLYFIDFEYGSYNYRGFDIGNHFNEYAGYDCDFSCYPSKEEQYHFFRHYLQPEEPDEVSQEDLEALYVESNTFMLASHLYWALWALIQARMSPIDFDYLRYFFLRYNEYKKNKEKYCSLARSFLAR
ncbi:probable ethanolamine kinase isoform X1 [Cucurbita moschata]|uniref:ethanolamine kinase n=1 Tax=Cucurbita moschata TaxID=3662 RepID=A0A6J1EUA6_CUCMO|nr:probable ethanolamine kinase isoform X1 [Cucurbita moschata]